MTCVPNSMEASLSKGVPDSSDSSGERRLSTLAKQMCKNLSPSCFSWMLCFAASAPAVVIHTTVLNCGCATLQPVVKASVKGYQQARSAH